MPSSRLPAEIFLGKLLNPTSVAVPGFTSATQSLILISPTAAGKDQPGCPSCPAPSPEGWLLLLPANPP